MTTTDALISGPHGHLITAWTELWNGATTLAPTICAPRVTIEFGNLTNAADGDLIEDPRGLAHFIEDFRATRAGLRYEVVEAATADGWGFCVWNASMGDRHTGGIDTFRFVDGLIQHAWSTAAQRPLAPAPNGASLV